MSAKEARNTIEELVQYEEKEWDDPVFPNRGSLNFGNSNMEQLLVKMKYQVDSLMKDAISLMGKSENLCGIMSNEVGYISPEPPHQEAFEGLVMNFILDKEEKVRRLEECMRIVKDDLMQLSLEVVEKLKEEIRTKEHNHNQFQKIQKITKYPETENSNSRKRNNEKEDKYWQETVINWSLFVDNGLERGFFESIHIDPFFGPQWANLFRINEPVYYELDSVTRWRHILYSNNSRSRQMWRRRRLRKMLGVYRDIPVHESRGLAGSSRGMDGPLGRWGQLVTWMTKHDQRSDWMYDHIVCQMQYLSTRDHLEPHLQIDPFSGREIDYPPFGYTEPLPHGYDYCNDTSPDGSS
ncbi:hypothetical protein Tco_0774638 [Tanacetum coccineum]|uniref:Uncharacterized protein n=1 Tax=Tanacetum coccineum TaxID=301880 RepID=A0ABQ4ZS78_9ASTR